MRFGVSFRNAHRLASFHVDLDPTRSLAAGPFRLFRHTRDDGQISLFHFAASNNAPYEATAPGLFASKRMPVVSASSR